MSRYISRDPFARHTITRVTVKYPVGSCGWCGSIRRTKTGVPFLYRYNVVHDSGRTDTGAGLFCSIDCHRTYHS